MKIDRLLEMVILFINKKKMTASYLSSHFGVTIKTIRRDIDTLTLAGIPIYSEVGQNGGYYINEDFTLRREIFSHSEVSLIESMLIGVGKSFKNDDAKSILQKIIASKKGVNKQLMVFDIGPWQQSEHSDLIFNVLEAGIINHKIIEIEYFKPGSPSHTRSIKPIRFILKAGNWFLKAFCLFKNDYRMFKLNRIADAQMTNKTFDPIEDDQADDQYFNHWYGVSDKGYPIRFYQEIYGKLDNLVPSNDIKWSQPFFDYDLNFIIDDWLISALLSLGEHIEIIDEELKAIYLEKLKKITALYE